MYIYIYIYIIGWILEFLAGPPCETWSRARAVRCDLEDRSGPRVIRKAEDLWGLVHLRLRELEQIDVGNLLLCFSAEAFLRLASTGGFGVVEHPREPDEPHFASIWKLPLFQMLRLLPGVELHSLSQGYLGAPSCKPTSLLCLNFPHISQAIVKNQVTATRPKALRLAKQHQAIGPRSAPWRSTPALNRASWRGNFSRPSHLRLVMPPFWLTTIFSKSVKTWQWRSSQTWTGFRRLINPFLNSSIEPRRQSQKAEWEKTHTHIYIIIHMYTRHILTFM